MLRASRAYPIKRSFLGLLTVFWGSGPLVGACAKTAAQLTPRKPVTSAISRLRYACGALTCAHAVQDPGGAHMHNRASTLHMKLQLTCTTACASQAVHHRLCIEGCASQAVHRRLCIAGCALQRYVLHIQADVGIRGLGLHAHPLHPPHSQVCMGNLNFMCHVCWWARHFVCARVQCLFVRVCNVCYYTCAMFACARVQCLCACAMLVCARVPCLFVRVCHACLRTCAIFVCARVQCFSVRVCHACLRTCAIFFCARVPCFSVRVCHACLCTCAMFVCARVQCFSVRVCHACLRTCAMLVCARVPCLFAHVCHICLCTCAMFFCARVPCLLAHVCHVFLCTCAMFFCARVPCLFVHMCHVCLCTGTMFVCAWVPCLFAHVCHICLCAALATPWVGCRPTNLPHPAHPRPQGGACAARARVAQAGGATHRHATAAHRGCLHGTRKSCSGQGAQHPQLTCSLGWKEEGPVSTAMRGRTWNRYLRVSACGAGREAAGGWEGAIAAWVVSLAMHGATRGREWAFSDPKREHHTHPRV